MSQLNVDPQEIAKFEALAANGGISILSSVPYIRSIPCA